MIFGVLSELLPVFGKKYAVKLQLTFLQGEGERKNRERKEKESNQRFFDEQKEDHIVIWTIHLSLLP